MIFMLHASASLSKFDEMKGGTFFHGLKDVPGLPGSLPGRGNLGGRAISAAVWFRYHATRALLRQKR